MSLVLGSTPLGAFGRTDWITSGVGPPMQKLVPRVNEKIASELGSQYPIPPEMRRGIPFRDIMLGAVDEVNMLQMNADYSVEKLMTGGDIGSAEVLAAVQKADIAFKLLMQIRNKLVGAYQEIQGIRV